MVGATSEVEGAPPPSRPGPLLPGHSVKGPALRGPALVVLGLAVLIVVAGLLGAALGSGPSSPAPAPVLHKVTLADGTTLALTPASVALRPLVSQGQPPTDVIDHLAVPAGSTPIGKVNDDFSAGSYDRIATFTTALATGEVVDLFRAALPRLGWHVIYTGAGTRSGRTGTEVLAKRASTDGNEWEVGVIASPVTAAGTTPFSLELFIAPEES